MIDYKEIDDYNEEFFYDQERQWEEYSNLIDEWEEPSPKEKDSAYVIFSLEQALSTLSEIGSLSSKYSISAEKAMNAIQDFIKVYTMNGEEGKNVRKCVSNYTAA